MLVGLDRNPYCFAAFEMFGRHYLLHRFVSGQRLESKKTNQRLCQVPFVYGRLQTNYRTICVNSWKKQAEEHVFIALASVRRLPVIRPIGPNFVKA